MASTISFSNTKEAALYFQRVMPFDGLRAAIENQKTPQTTLSQHIPYEDAELAVKVANEILGVSDSNTHLLHLMSLHWAISHSLSVEENPNRDDNNFLKYFNSIHNLNLTHDDFKTSMSADSIIVKIAKSFFDENGFRNSSIWRGGLVQNPKKNEGNSFELAISGLNLVNTDTLPWESVIEFRRDKDSIAALRDLRLFFTENFSGKDRTYIEDKLLSLLAKQEAAAKLWGFETAQKSLAVAISNQSTVLASLSGLAAAFGGAPLTIAAGAALIVPIASCALEFSKCAIESQKEQIDRPTHFLTRLKKLNKD